RLLQAARPRTDLRLRLPDVHHRRRRRPHHPAHRDHAALRQLRGVEHRLQLRHARPPAARLRPGTVEDRVNDRIRRVAVVGIVLLAALVLGTTYWQTWAQGELAAQKDNAVQLVAQFKIDRGVIRASNGEVVALNHVLKKNGNTFFLRHYPTGKLVSNVVGYSTQGRSRAGLERSLNDYLTSSNSDLHTVLDRTLNSLEGKTVKGNSVQLTLRTGPQFVAQRALGSLCGAAVALDVKTGKVLVMATSPTYNPNLVENHFDQIDKTRAHCAGP